jgi:hypothetical protein
MVLFMFFPDISYFFGKTIKGKKVTNATDLSLLLLEEALVATVTGMHLEIQIALEFHMLPQKIK